MKALGILLIVFGTLGGVGTAASQFRDGAAPGQERFFQAIGGMIFCLVLVVPGFLLLNRRHSTESGTAPLRPRKKRPPREPEPEPEPVTPPSPKHAVGADGKVALTCLACYTEVRAEVPPGAEMVDCPKCGREIKVA